MDWCLQENGSIESILAACNGVDYVYYPLKDLTQAQPSYLRWLKMASCMITETKSLIKVN